MSTPPDDPATPAAGADPVLGVEDAERCGWACDLPDEPADRLVGRDEELATLRALVTRPRHRMLTLVGVGGVGKSRLALRVAHDVADTYEQRVTWVALDGVGDSALLVAAIATRFGVADERGRDVLDRLAESIGDQPALLVLDTLEHLAAGAGILARVLAAVPTLTILATSRVPLGIPGERTFSVEPLPTPPRNLDDPEALLANGAVALLVARAAAARPDATVSPATAQAFASIACRLDGIPLAIELAAASLRTLEPHQLADRLIATIGPLELDDTTAPVRRRSLRATMDWSHELLTEPHRRLARRLGVLVGAFDAATVGAVLGGAERRGLAPVGLDVADGLDALHRAYLLRRVDRPDERTGPRYEMLRTVRADARERLERSGEAVAMRWAHAYHFLELAEAAEQDLDTDREPAALERLERAHDDLGEALDWSIECGDGEFAVRLAGALAEFWRTRGYLTEGRIRLQTALAWGAGATPARRHKALRGAGILASYQSDYGLARSMLSEALALARAAGDEEATAATLNWIGTNAYGAGDLEDAERSISEALALRRRIGQPGPIATSLNALGGIHHFRGDLDRALELFEESLAIKQQQRNPNGIAVALTNIGLVQRDAGHPERAADRFAEAREIWARTGDRQRWAVALHNAALVDLDSGRRAEAAAALRQVAAIMRELNDRTGIAYALGDLARVLVAAGELDEAEEAARVSLRTALSLGSGVVLPLALEAAAMIAAARQDDERAVRLWAAAEAERRRTGFANMPADERLLRTSMDRVRARVAEDDWTRWWRAGEALAADGAVAEAVSDGSTAPEHGDGATPTAVPAGSVA